MRKKVSFIKYLMADPLALSVACIISLLFANGMNQYLNTSKKNNDQFRNETVACFQFNEDLPTEVPNDRWLSKFVIFQRVQKNNYQTAVTYSNHLDYGYRLMGSFYELSQPPAWLPSIPVAHRKLII